MPSLTTVATHAIQFIGGLDSGETLSAQQLTDALSAANNLLLNWFVEQNLTMQELIQEQKFQIQGLIDQLAGVGLAHGIAYTLVAGAYVAPILTAPTWTPGTVPSFPDTTTSISLPNGYQRALETSLGIELAPQYVVPVSEALLKIAMEARAAVNPMPTRRPIPGQSATSEAPGSPGGA